MLGLHSSASGFVILARGFLHSPCKILAPPLSSACLYEVQSRMYSFSRQGYVHWACLLQGSSRQGSVARQYGVMYCMILCRTWTKGQSLIGSNDGRSTAGPVDVP